MALIVAGLAAYTFYEFKNADDTVSAAKGEKRVFYLLRDQIEQIEITKNGVEIVLKKQNDKWQMLKPVEDLADASAVESFMYSLLTQKGKEFRGDEGKPKWADFGLEPAGSKVTIRSKDKAETLEVSSKNAFDGSYFIRVKDDLWLGDRGLAQVMEREPSAFRSRKVYRGPEPINSVEVKLDYDGTKDSYKLKRGGAKELWTIDPAPAFAVDSAKVAEWVQKIAGLTGVEFAPEMAPGKPSMELKLGDELIAISGDISSDVFVASGKRVYKMGAAALDTVRVPQAYFRDGKVPFKFNVELVKEIEVRTSAMNSTFVKKDSAWELKNPPKDMELDQDKLMELVHAVQSLEAAEFVDGAASGLPATPQLTFKGGDGKSLLSVSWGAEYKPKFGFNKGSTLRFAKVAGVKEALGLPKDKLDRLVDSAIIKKKAPPQTADQAEKK